MKPTRRTFCTFATAAVLFAAGVSTGDQLLLTLSGTAALAPLLGAAELICRARTTRHTLHYTQERFSSPGPVEVNWDITPTRRTRFTAELDSSRGKQPPLLFAGNSTQREQVCYHNQLRGHMSVGPIAEQHTDIFGCFTVTRTVTTEIATIVWPKMWRIEMSSYHSRKLGPGAPRRNGTTGDINKLRPYLLGDDPRHIHWRTSARRGELHVIEKLDDTLPQLCVAVDTSGEPLLLDHICSAAASLVANAYENGIATVCTIADREKFDIGRKQSRLHETLDALALTQQSTQNPRIIHARTVIAVSTPHNADNLLEQGVDLVISVGDSPTRSSTQLVPWRIQDRFDEVWTAHREHHTAADSYFT